MNKILFISAHTDDAEMGCGGSIARYVEKGNDVYITAFSIAEESVPEGLSRDILLNESRAASKVLGIDPKNLFIYKYPVRKFTQFRQEILEDLVTLNDLIQPDLVFIPSKYDTHQDHSVIAAEGFRAFKYTSILGYEIIWNNIAFESTAFISLKERHIEKKLDALKCYKSQALRLKRLGRIPVESSHIKALAKVRGSQITTEYAEAFNIIRWMIK